MKQYPKIAVKKSDARSQVKITNGCSDIFLVLSNGSDPEVCLLTTLNLPLPGNEVTGGGADKCTYKNQTYSVGEVWKDGCDYNCTCLDGLVTHCSTL